VDKALRVARLRDLAAILIIVEDWRTGTDAAAYIARNEKLSQCTRLIATYTHSFLTYGSRALDRDVRGFPDRIRYCARARFSLILE